MKPIIKSFSLITLPLAFVTLAVFTLAARGVDAQVETRPLAPAIPGRYIIVFRDAAAASPIENILTAEDIRRTYGLDITHRYERVLKGLAANVPASRLEALKRDPRVAFVSEDREVHIAALEPQSHKGIRVPAGTKQPQTSPTGIRRIGAGTGTNTGAGVGVAVIDTGIDLSHPDLVANIASASKTCVAGTRSAKDDNGHGTHVAGTIAAVNNSIGVVGVAPDATLYAVKVLNRNGSGTWSSVICGIDWITANATTLGIKVANMSLGGSGTSDNNCGATNGDALHSAICNSVAQGVTYVVAAGNSGADAVGFVPAAYDDAVITVSALADSDGAAGGSGSSTSYGADDTFATFSNFGAPVGLGAPGVSILSTWRGGGYKTISGTSMATPHVSGAAALFIASHPGAGWTDVKKSLMALGELVGFGHTDPSGVHPEPVLLADSL